MTHSRVEQLNLLQCVHFTQGIYFNRVENRQIQPTPNEIIH